jgi:selenocysteine lyase/cysteine desulfurase
VEKRRRQEMELTGQFIEGLSDAHVRICGTKDLEKRVGVVSLDFEYDDNAQAAYYLDSEFGIRTRTGMHCAPNAHKTIGTFPQGTVRFSFGYGTTAEDVEYAARAVREVAE